MIRQYTATLWVVSALALSEWAWAVGADSTRPDPVLQSSGFLTQLTLGLVIVLILAVGLLWLLRRYAVPHNNVIQIIAGLPLGSRERLLLIEVDNIRLLIGITAAQMHTLHVFPTIVAPSPTTSFDEIVKTALPVATSHVDA